MFMEVPPPPHFFACLRSQIRLTLWTPLLIDKIDDQTVSVGPEDGPSFGARRAPELRKAFGRTSTKRKDLLDCLDLKATGNYTCFFNWGVPLSDYWSNIDQCRRVRSGFCSSQSPIRLMSAAITDQTHSKKQGQIPTSIECSNLCVDVKRLQTQPCEFNNGPAPHIKPHATGVSNT